LYHLDNYEKCLAHDAGVYCLGTFHVTPLEEPNPVYELMKEYSEETYAFNHTLIHRGYCVSSRCPDLNATHLAARFEQCTARQTLTLQATLTTLKYCRTRADTLHYQPPTIPQIIFLAVVLFLLMMNVIGTAAAHPLSMLLQNSTGTEQMFVVISGFLYAYQLRIFAKKHRISCRLLPIFIAKRIIRLSPVFFLVVGFAATWWPALGSGPIWTATVGAESKICKEKFWAHLLYINNLVQPEKHCVLPTWYMAVDVQMHILSTFIMLFLLQFPKRMLLILGLLFGASCVLNAVLVYIFDWVPMLYLTVSPENLRTLFLNVPSFSGLYISPWGSISA
ncbi:Uncharacterized protein OBRU01_14754, partial [Operophtera brumata]